MKAEQQTDGRTTRATQQRLSRRNEILAGALRVFARDGYHQTHVSDIIEAAGIARGTFYLYFESKSAIFLELLERMISELRGNVVGVEIAPNKPPLEEQLADTVHRILHTVAHNRMLARIVFREAVGLDEEVDRILRAFYEDILDYIRSALNLGKSLGLVRSEDTEVAAICVLGTIKQFMEQVVMMESSQDVDIDRMAQAMLDFNLRGLLR